MKKKITRSSFSALMETAILMDEREKRAVIGGDYWDDHGYWTTDFSGNIYWTRLLTIDRKLTGKFPNSTHNYTVTSVRTNK